MRAHRGTRVSCSADGQCPSTLTDEKERAGSVPTASRAIQVIEIEMIRSLAEGSGKEAWPVAAMHK
jgi:hypothetical protein